MHRLVAPGAPASPPRDESAVIKSPDDQGASRGLLLEMTFETEGLVALRQQLIVDRPMNRVAGRAAFPHRFVLENEGPPLRLMALAARFIDAREGRPQPLKRWTFMWVVAVVAAHPAFHYRMMKWQVEFAALVQMAVEADLRRFPWIDDVAPPAARFGVQAARPVA